MNIKMLKAAFAGMVLSVSGLANAGLIEYELLSISERFGSTSNTYNGNGYIGAYNSSYSGIFCLERTTCKTALQADITNLLALGDITLNSVFLSFDLKESSNGTQDVTASAFDSSGVLSHHFSAPTSYAQDIFSVNGQTSNSLDITNLFSQGYNLGNDWFALHLNASTDGMWTWTQAGYDRDDANVRITVDYSVNSVPEPSTLAIFALGIMGLASRRFKKQ
jgi:hypothetical protein